LYEYRCSTENLIAMTAISSDNHLVINHSRLLERFLQYVRIDSTADPDSGTYPSSPGQWELGKLLVSQLDRMSLEDVHQDDNGLVWATIPATDGGGSATVALFAHLDTSPEASGKDVCPTVIESYAGGDIPLADGTRILVESAPELDEMVGQTLIVTDGTTLLGGDDKAGVAIMMELAAHLIEHPEIPHGTIKLLFTCDEEIGAGTQKIDLGKLKATVGYTIDGGGAGQLDVETFSADGVKVTFHGRNIHPAIAKGRMVSAVRGAASFVSSLPVDQFAPEATDDRQGFIHPYQLDAGVGEASVRLLLRSFDTTELTALADRVRDAATATEQRFPGLRAEVSITRQYRNMRDGLQSLPESTRLARQAFLNLGRDCEESIIRGGTDGSQLTEMGLPTPNLSSGQHNIHSLHEFASLDEMVAALQHLVELLGLWSRASRS
jgi:tripeptide aminopeptidase